MGLNSEGFSIPRVDTAKFIRDITENQDSQAEEQPYLCEWGSSEPRRFALCPSSEARVGAEEAAGRLDRHILHEEGIISDPGHYHCYSSLRTAVEGSLLEKKGKKFIANDGSKRYRVSTHPDFITYARGKLEGHPDSGVGELIKLLT